MREPITVPVHRLSGHISIHFITVYSSATEDHQKITETPYFWGSRSFQITEVNTTKKHITSAYYDMQHVCAYLQPYSR